MSTPESSKPSPSNTTPPAGAPKKPASKGGMPSFKADQNRGPAQKMDRNRTLHGAPKTGRTPRR